MREVGKLDMEDGGRRLFQNREIYREKRFSFLVDRGIGIPYTLKAMQFVVEICPPNCAVSSVIETALFSQLKDLGIGRAAALKLNEQTVKIFVPMRTLQVLPPEPEAWGIVNVRLWQSN